MRISLSKLGIIPIRKSLSTAAAAALPSAAEHHTAMPADRRHRRKESVVVIMGATGTGKSKLSVDVATRFRSEIINSDKIQVYRGLDITTNKIPVPDRRGVPHHLIGCVDPASGELTASEYRSLAGSVVTSITARRRLPVVAGGSNSFIHAMVSDRFDPKRDPFGYRDHRFRYRCCFVWVDVEKGVLREYLDRRVDEMVGSGMVEELEGYFGKEGAELESHVGLAKAIGVPEFRGYFGKEWGFEEAVEAIKVNTWRLAEAQVGKIGRLDAECGWGVRRVDATDAVRARLSGAGRAEEERAWARDVVGPTFEAVEEFLDLEGEEEEGGCGVAMS